MRLTRAAALAAGTMSLALLTACGLGGPKYPTFGDVAYKIEGSAVGPDGGAAIPTTIYRDGPRMRVETTLPGRGPAAIVFNEATGAAYVLSAVAAAPAAVPAPAGATPAAAPGTPAVAGATPAAAPAAAPAGVAVRVADAETPAPLEAPWAALGAENAQSTGSCNVAGESGHRWRPKAEGEVRDACITQDGIVLEVREGERVLFQATRLTRGEQPAGTFGVPAGYAVVDPQAVVEGVGATMGQLDSVTGAPPAAAPATSAPATPARQ